MFSLFKTTTPMNNNNQVEIIATEDFAYHSEDGEFIKRNNDDSNGELLENIDYDYQPSSEQNEPPTTQEPIEPPTDEITQTDFLNENDTDERNEKSKIYIISVNSIPLYYEHTLDEAKNQMLNMANYFVENLNIDYGQGHIIVTDSELKNAKVIAPYNFLMLTYNHVIHELTIEYAIKLQ